jgi:hypothetical protein
MPGTARTIHIKGRYGIEDTQADFNAIRFIIMIFYPDDAVPRNGNLNGQ